MELCDNGLTCSGHQTDKNSISPAIVIPVLCCLWSHIDLVRLLNSSHPRTYKGLFQHVMKGWNPYNALFIFTVLNTPTLKTISV